MRVPTVHIIITHYIITSAVAKRLFYPASVCLLATSCKNYQMDYYKNFTRDVSVDKEKLIQFHK